MIVIACNTPTDMSLKASDVVVVRWLTYQCKTNTLETKYKAILEWALKMMTVCDYICLCMYIAMFPFDNPPTPHFPEQKIKQFG